MDQADRFVFDLRDRYGRWPVNTAGTGTSRIQHPDSVRKVVPRYMGVTVNNRISAGEDISQLIEFGNAMAVCERKAHPRKLHFGFAGCTRPDIESIRVAPHGRHGCDRLQICEDFRRSDIASMKDVVNVSKQVEYSRPQGTVCVAYQSNAHTSFSSRHFAAEPDSL